MKFLQKYGAVIAIVSIIGLAFFFISKNKRKDETEIDPNTGEEMINPCIGKINIQTESELEVLIDNNIEVFRANPTFLASVERRANNIIWTAWNTLEGGLRYESMRRLQATHCFQSKTIIPAAGQRPTLGK